LRRAFFFAALFVFFGDAFCCPATSAPASALEAWEAEARLPFGAGVPESAARRVARARAWHKALERAAPDFASFAQALGEDGVSSNGRALAAAVYTPEARGRVFGRNVYVRVRLSAPRRTALERLRKVLRAPDVPELRAEMLELEQKRADEAARLIRDASARQDGRGTDADAARTERIIFLAEQLEAFWLFGMLLPQREGRRWNNPLEALPFLEQAAAMDPGYPPLRSALGEVLLQLDRPQDALDELNRALAGDGAPAGALYARALAHLRLQLPTLAESDLNEALRRDPRPAAWWRARGALRMLRRDFGPMCGDFLQACARGDCEGLAAARERGLCLSEGE
jgi:tetratricopeptide (TPR) repeat protein